MVTQRKAAGSTAATTTKAAKSVKAAPMASKTVSSAAAATKTATPVKATSAAGKAARESTATAAVSSRASRQTTAATRIEPDQRREYVEIAAYFIAERRGFEGGDETADWLAAEAEIERLMTGR
jgi:hypothetical protein